MEVGSAETCGFTSTAYKTMPFKKQIQRERSVVPARLGEETGQMYRCKLQRVRFLAETPIKVELYPQNMKNRLKYQLCTLARLVHGSGRSKIEVARADFTSTCVLEKITRRHRLAANTRGATSSNTSRFSSSASPSLPLPLPPRAPAPPRSPSPIPHDEIPETGVACWPPCGRPSRSTAACDPLSNRPVCE